jgi:hypothetical protein
LRDLSRQIRDEARKVLTGIRSEAEIAREREEELMGRLAELKVAAASANEREVKLRALEREAEAQRALLESYLVRYREAAVARRGSICAGQSAADLPRGRSGRAVFPENDPDARRGVFRIDDRHDAGDADARAFLRPGFRAGGDCRQGRAGSRGGGNGGVTRPGRRRGRRQ